MRSLLAALLVICNAAAVPSLAHGQTAPQGMRGKSIVVAWREQRNQRRGNQKDFHDVTAPLSRTIYISTAGRPFSRFTGTLGSSTGSAENVGASGTSYGGGPREVRFDGRTMTLTSTTKGGLARRTTIEFNESFTNCQAQVVFAKQAGRDVVVGRSLVTGQPMEIRSVTVTGVTCSIRAGNVFAH